MMTPNIDDATRGADRVSDVMPLPFIKHAKEKEWLIAEATGQNLGTEMPVSGLDLTQSCWPSYPLVYDASGYPFMPSHPHSQSELDFRVSTCVDRLKEKIMVAFNKMMVALVCFLASPLAGLVEAGDGWRTGRATFYGIWWSIHTGSCGYGNIDYWQGTGWDVAAIPDSHYEYNWSCGCCGDMDHFDLSYHTFDKLAPRHYGVIGLKYRPVACPSSYLENRHHLGRKLKEGEMVVLDERFERPEGVQGALPSV
ncbi:hypothetical protein BSKO_04589 [Bryopsis sp. KO-2023]|nr:hypothetical protein BSKO_04589 [Bryopsis sp. KO-2023]